MKIPYFDLKRQYGIIKDELEPNVIKTLRSTQYSLGPEVELFEKNFSKFINTKYCAGVNTGTSALHLALLGCGVGQGDEVITVSMTFIATVMAISYTGAKPIFVDVCKKTQLINYMEIENKVTSRTKAILVVHLYGQCAEMKEINKIARKHNLKVIEDSSQAHGAKHFDICAGSMGDVGTFSFYPGKNLGACGEGGAITTNDKKIFKKVNELRNWSQPKRYHHNEISYNYRMDGLQASILNIKLKYLTNWTLDRRKIAEYYKNNLDNKKFTLSEEKPYNFHVYHIFSIFCNNAKKLQKYLNENGIGTNFHYPIPAHLQKPYLKLGYYKTDLPVTEKLSKNQLSIPIYPEMKLSEVKYVLKILNNY